MSLSVGIVGLPNAGKSTLFNALASRRLAETAPRPFTTIDPHEAVVALPDCNLQELAAILSGEDIKIFREKPLSILISQYPDIPKIVPASVTFIDIAGLVKGAHKGEGLGNQFLAKIREVDVIVHIVRAFKDPKVSHQHPTHEPGSEKQILEDIEIVNLELELGGIEKRPTIYVLNADEQEIRSELVKRLIKLIEKEYGGSAVSISAKLEEEFIDLDQEERKDYLKELGIEKSGLERLIKKAYKLLGLISFYTIKGGKEIHAWGIKKGSNAIEAAEKVHTDFAKNFIKAEVIGVEELLEIRGWKEAKEKGKVRLEGRDYKVQDRDIIEFKTGA
jgi:ribosome-binding ATPase YchF (GTP1/OBG family)